MAIPLPLPTKIAPESEKRYKNNRLEAQYGDGYKQISNNGINSLVDMWSIAWVWVKQSDKDTIIAALESSNTFTWTPFNEPTQKTFLIVKDSIRMIFTANHFKISCELERFF